MTVIELYLMLGFISSFLLNESGNDNDVQVFSAVCRNEKGAQLAIGSLKELPFVDCKANPALVRDKSRLSLPMDLGAGDFEQGFAVEVAGDVLQVKELARFRGNQFNLRNSIFVEILSGRSNDWAGLITSVNLEVLLFIGLAIVFGSLRMLAFRRGLRIPLSPHARYKYDSKTCRRQLREKCRKRYLRECPLRVPFVQFREEICRTWKVGLVIIERIANDVVSAMVTED
jgi:hypothetical protein